MGYVMDTAEEGARIEAKTDRGLTLEQLRWGRVVEGVAVLDLGCAAGTISRMMAEIVGPGGRVYGVDASLSRLEEGAAHANHRPWIEYRQGDAARLPLDDGTVDVAWSRFVFEYLPDPWAALAEMVRVTRPGGTVIVGDLDGNCVWHHPEDPALAAEIAAVLQTLGQGFRPFVGRTLFTAFKDAGLADVAVDVRAYHLIAGAIDAEQESHWRMKIRGVGQAVERAGWEPERARALERRFLAYLQDPRTLTYSVLFTVRGTRV